MIRSEIDCVDRFWNRVDKNGPNGCWIWMGCVNSRGYGRIGTVGKVVATHRLSWELAYGFIPDDLYVCHKCDNPRCVNPLHLFLGTPQENNADRDHKGRTAKGNKRGNRKLIDNQISEIRDLYASGRYSYREIACKYDVGLNTIYRIVHRDTWDYIKEYREEYHA